MKRRKRSQSYNEGAKKSKGVKVYQYYESKRTKSKKPRHRDKTTTVYTTKTVNGRDEPRYRDKFVFKRPQQHEASELDDLANDQYFYEQLEKNRPPTESSIEVEHAPDRRPNVNRDVTFLHGSGKKRRKNRPKLANIYEPHSQIGAVRDEDVYGDYGEMVLPHRDVEMHDTFERNTHESHVHTPSQYSYDGDGRTQTRKRRPKCNEHNPLKKNRLTIDQNTYNQPGTVFVHRPQSKKKFEKIMVTKKLSGPEELHAEIDRIFQRKNKNYSKPGHSKAHWELRIMPQRYEELEEYPIN